MNTKITSILDQLKALTLLEAAQLVTAIEETFGVDASVSTAPIIANTPLAIAEVIEEKTAFDIHLTEVPADKKISILKIIRNVTGLGLKESKEIVDNVPKIVKEGTTKEEAESIKKDLEAAGAKALVK